MSIGTGFAHFHGLSGDNCTHAHNALQIVLAKDPFLVEFPGEVLSTRGVIIQMNQSHRLSPAPVHIVYIEAESCFGKMVRQQLNNKAFVEIDRHRVEHALEALSMFSDSGNSLLNVIEALYGIAIEEGIVLDARIDRALMLINEHLESPLTYEDLAQHVGLSESHFRSLFFKNMGLSMKRYRLWARLKKALKLSKAGRDFTSAAHGAGFSDSAHFSRTFRSMFGTSPSLALKGLH